MIDLKPDKLKTKATNALDWERIEVDYRAGLLSLREIAQQHGISHQAIAKRAKSSDWVKDLSAKIRLKAESLVAKTLVDSKVDRKKASTDKEIVQVNAQKVADVSISHRTDIQRARAINNNLLLELEGQTGAENVALIQQLGEIMRQPDDKGQDRRNDLYLKIISLPERSKTMKTLADGMRVLVDMERQAYNMDDPANKTPPPGAAGHIPQAVTVIHVAPPVRRREDDEE